MNAKLIAATIIDRIDTVGPVVVIKDGKWKASGINTEYAKEALLKHPDRVLGCYDSRVHFDWLVEDLQYAG
jgi:hypothetical protein